MALIIQEPLKIVNGLETKALAARSQLLYQVQREDYKIVDVTDDFGDMRLDLPLALGAIRAQFSVGEKVYFKDENEGLSGEYILKSIDITGGGFTVLVTETPFTVKSSGFILLLNRPNYHLAISVIDAEDGSVILERPFRYVLSQSGKANLDFSSILSSYMSAGEDVKLSQEYYLEIVETWTGSDELPITTTTLQAVYTRKQLLSLGGANMWENLLREEVIYTYQSTGELDGLLRLFMQDADGDIQSLFNIGSLYFIEITQGYDSGYYLLKDTSFSTQTRLVFDIPYNGSGGINGHVRQLDSGSLLTKFKNPIIWRGWNRLANVLIDQELVNRETAAGLFYRDVNINKGVVGASTFITYNRGNIGIRNTPISTNNSPNAAYVEVKAFNNLTSIGISETLFYRILDDCPNSIMLDWINSLGGIEQHLFSIDQTVSNDSGEGLIAERPVTGDIEFVRRTRRRFPQQASQSIIMTAEHLTTSQLSALHELKETESLRVYLTKDGTEYVEAVVTNTYETIHQTRDSLHSITVEVLMPDGFDFFEAKKY